MPRLEAGLIDGGAPAKMVRDTTPAWRDTGAMSQENVELVRALLEAFNKGDADAMLGPATDDVDVRPPSHLLQDRRGDRLSRRGRGL